MPPPAQTVRPCRSSATSPAWPQAGSIHRPWNLRRRIETDGEGRYRFRSIPPAGYGCPPDGPTRKLLDQLGRHGQRPAHVHFFVSAPDYRQLTTQINIAGDKFLYDDFVFAT